MGFLMLSVKDVFNLLNVIIMPELFYNSTGA